MNFKEITDDIVSRPSVYMLIIFTLLSLMLFGDLEKPLIIWQLFTNKYAGHEGTFFFMLLVILYSIIFIIVAHNENSHNFKFKHKILQNPFTKTVVLLALIYHILFFLLPSLILYAYVFLTIIKTTIIDLISNIMI